VSSIFEYLSTAFCVFQYFIVASAGQARKHLLLLLLLLLLMLLLMGTKASHSTN
jgi:hypothetical protein